MHTFEQQLIDSGKMPIFEIEVTNKLTNDKEYLVCEIGVNNNKLEATREPLTYKEQESDKIAFSSIDIDLDFTLDHHLEELYSEITTEIMQSDFFILS